MSCEHSKDKLAEYAAGFLRGRAAQRVADHVAACADCLREVERLRRAGGFAGALGLEQPARDLWPGVQAAILARRVPQVAWRGTLRAAVALAVMLALLVGAVYLARPMGRPPAAPVVAADEASSAYLGQYAVSAWRAPLADTAALGDTLASAMATSGEQQQ
ncbi:MAG: hypothetical protein JSV65_19100 [Armatimonadota bacterium]|nr:MAG: hypothetical protein JSV65_19100 [Armatimonadota bacterium]